MKIQEKKRDRLEELERIEQSRPARVHGKVR